MTDEEFETYLLSLFDQMGGVILDRTDTFGRGHDMHDEAMSVAPAWLRSWYSDRRWAICFARPENFFVLAEAFGMSRASIISELKHYHDKEPTNERV